LCNEKAYCNGAVPGDSLNGSIASAEDCSCSKGGLGIPIGKFFIGFGYRTFSSVLGCDTNIGLGIGLGADNDRVQVGIGYSTGVINLGIGVKGRRQQHRLVLGSVMTMVIVDWFGRMKNRSFVAGDNLLLTI